MIANWLEIGDNFTEPKRNNNKIHTHKSWKKTTKNEANTTHISLDQKYVINQTNAKAAFLVEGNRKSTQTYD